MFTVSEYERQAVRIMISFGANINDARSHGGETVLHSAAKHASPVVVEALVPHGVDINAVNNEGDNTLHVSQHTV